MDSAQSYNVLFTAPNEIALTNSKTERICALKAVMRGLLKPAAPTRDCWSDRSKISTIHCPTGLLNAVSNANFKLMMTPKSRISDTRSKVALVVILQYDVKMFFANRKSNHSTFQNLASASNYQNRCNKKNISRAQRRSKDFANWGAATLKGPQSHQSHERPWMQ